MDREQGGLGIEVNVNKWPGMIIASPPPLRGRSATPVALPGGGYTAACTAIVAI
jgi:hypothetical protein